MSEDDDDRKAKDRRQDRTALERHMQTIIMSLVLVSITGGTAMLIRLDKGVAILNTQMEEVRRKIGSLETLVQASSINRVLIQEMSKDVDHCCDSPDHLRRGN